MRPASAAMVTAPGADPLPSRAATSGAAGKVRIEPAAAALERLEGEWQALAAVAAEPNPFAESWFVGASLRHLARSEVRLAEVRDGGVLIGVMPLLVEPRLGRMNVRTVQNWRHFHAFLGAPLVRAGAERAFWTALIGALDGMDWAPNFLHLRDLPEDGPLHIGLVEAAASLGRPAPTVYRECRAMLRSSLGKAAYYEESVRKKKRKELARLRNRLEEVGPLSCRRWRVDDDLAAWCETFLALERSGWKGEAGTALACADATRSFFHDAIAGAAAAGRLDFLRMDVGERPVAMLINFLTPPGAYSFKTAYDEDFARFSPGVLIQLENLAILDRSDITWTDSCAVEQHPMIDSLWRERRSIVRVSVPLAGLRRRATFHFVRALERASAARRRLNQQERSR